MTTIKKGSDTVRKPPPNAGKGRPKGAVNKTTATLKDAILAAAKAVGNDGKGKGGLEGYLKRVAASDTKSFAALLGRVLPLQLTGDGGGPVEMKATIDPVGLSTEQLRALASIPVHTG